MKERKHSGAKESVTEDRREPFGYDAPRRDRGDIVAEAIKSLKADIAKVMQSASN